MRGRRVIGAWDPEDREFWEREGRHVARRNLIGSVCAEHVGFSVWSLFAVLALFLGVAHGVVAAGKFTLVAVASLVGGALRVPYGFAVARTLGLVPEYRETAFEAIFPSVRAGDFNVGMSSFTDTKERQESVDFVDYFEAGTQWAQQVGSSVDPDNACGLRVGVSYASLQETEEIPAKSAACEAAGLPPIGKAVYVSQNDLNTALINGEVDAMSADSPVTGFAIKTSGGALEAAGQVFDAAPYGWPVAKGSALAESLRLALEHLIETGEYRTIATMWGVEQGMLDTPTINGATK